MRTGEQGEQDGRGVLIADEYYPSAGSIIKVSGDFYKPARRYQKYSTVRRRPTYLPTVSIIIYPKQTCFAGTCLGQRLDPNK